MHLWKRLKFWQKTGIIYVLIYYYFISLDLYTHKCPNACNECDIFLYIDTGLYVLAIILAIPIYSYDSYIEQIRVHETIHLLSNPFPGFYDFLKLIIILIIGSGLGLILTPVKNYIVGVFTFDSEPSSQGISAVNQNNSIHWVRLLCKIIII